MKPAWLNKKISLRNCSSVKETLRSIGVETVCEQAMCPNIGECFNRNEATFLILGPNCTRMCSFCNIKKSSPLKPDINEPGRVAKAVKELKLEHVVITSVTRDDIEDGGASFFAETVTRIRELCPQVTVETLIPDFKLSLTALKIVADAGPDIIAHNLETVPALYASVRKGADYLGSLNLLRLAKEMFSLKTKSSLILGIGETQEEVISVMQDLRNAKCDFLSIGQYLAPSKGHYPVKKYINPEEFDFYKKLALDLGFLHVESAPYVRSSYMAGDYLS